MPKRLDIQESELRTLYIEQGLTHREIAQKHGVARRTIGRLMERLGIPVRQPTRNQAEHPCVNCGQLYRTVRALARRIYKESGEPLSCVVCGYSAHVEIAHIKAISDFDKSTLIREVNGLENLIALCPNHHWEFDNDLIDLTLYINKRP